MLPNLDEIIASRGDDDQDSIDKVYSDYLARMEDSRLSTEKTFDFIRDFLLAATANAANTTMVFFCIEIGMSAWSAFFAGLSFGCIPVAFYINRANINLESEYKVKNIGALAAAAGCGLVGFSVSYSSAGEKRTLMEYTNIGLKENSKLIAQYEVKASPVPGLNLHFVQQVFSGAANTAIYIAVAILAIKFALSSKRM